MDELSRWSSGRILRPDRRLTREASSAATFTATSPRTTRRIFTTGPTTPGNSGTRPHDPQKHIANARRLGGNAIAAKCRHGISSRLGFYPVAPARPIPTRQPGIKPRHQAENGKTPPSKAAAKATKTLRLRVTGNGKRSPQPHSPLRNNNGARSSSNER